MKVLIACKRGNIAERNRHGHCMCADCVAFRNKRSNETKNPAIKAAWIAANKAKSAAYQAKWIAANTTKRREIEKAWRAANQDKVAAMNARGGAKWAANKKGARMASVRARQIAKLKRTPSWADLDAIALFYKEAARLTKETGIPHEVDHKFPLQGALVSGLHVQNNLQILHRSANRSKGIKCEF